MHFRLHCLFLRASQGIMLDREKLGVVFDLDGVLIDSHDQHEAAWFQLAEEIGQPMTAALFKDSFGMRNEVCIPAVFGWTDESDHENIAQWGNRKEEIYRELLSRAEIESLPGTRAFLDCLQGANIPIAVGSSTSVLNIKLCLQATGLTRYFGDKITGAEDVSRGKPAPDVFLRAAELADRKPEHCVVIEDAHVGVEAGLAANMKVIALTTTHPAESFGGKPHLVTGRLDRVSLVELFQLFE